MDEDTTLAPLNDTVQRVVELVGQGYTPEQIAQELGYISAQYDAAIDIDSALTLAQSQNRERSAYNIDIQLGLLHTALRSLSKEVQAGTFKAIELWCKILDHRAKLLGLYPDNPGITQNITQVALVWPNTTTLGQLTAGEPPLPVKPKPTHKGAKGDILVKKDYRKARQGNRGRAPSKTAKAPYLKKGLPELGKDIGRVHGTKRD